MKWPSRRECALHQWGVAGQGAVLGDGWEERICDRGARQRIRGLCIRRLHGWRCHRLWQACHVLIVDRDARSRIDLKGDQVFVTTGLIPECIVTVGIAPILECVSFLLVATK